MASIIDEASALPCPAMSSAVPWSGEVRGNGSPSVTFTALPKLATLIAVMPTSWYGAMTASNSPRMARTNTVSAGNGPSRPLALAAGASTSSSSRPKRPPSPACGLSAHSAMRGSAMLNAVRSPARVTLATRAITAAVSSAGTSRRGTCVVASTTRRRSLASIMATSHWQRDASISVCPGKS